jgi:hypothetical protein
MAKCWSLGAGKKKQNIQVCNDEKHAAGLNNI